MRLNIEYKLEAQARCQKCTSTLVLVTFVYSLLVSLGSFMSLTVGVQGQMLITFAMMLLMGPLTFGFAYVIREVQLGNKPKVSQLFFGFNIFLKTFSLLLMQTLFCFLWSMLLIVPGIMKAYSYSMAFYVLLDDPSLSVMECLKKSEEMMRGHRMQLFSLQISYIFSYLLGMLTFGIYLLFAIPKINLSQYLFFLDVSGKAPAEKVEIIDPLE